jgi:hypothetical protein
MLDHSQIATYLAQGFKPEKVCLMVGCQPSTLSELIKTPKFQELYQPLRTKFSSDRIDKKYEDIEEKVLKQLEEEIHVSEVPQLVKILDAVNNYRKTKLPQIQTGMTNQGIINVTQQVTLTLPEHAKSNLTLNEQGEIIAFGDRSLVPLPSQKVIEIFNEMNEGATT